MIKKVMKCVIPLMALVGVVSPGIVFGGLVGEPAPALNVREWIKGGPVDLKPGTNVFVLEIFETKLPASRASLTNLSEVQAEFKDKGVIIAAVSDESPGILKQFFQDHGSNLDFAVGADNGRHTALAYMKPVNRGGLPYAFIIGTNGDLLWHGDPRSPQRGLKFMLYQILGAQYDEVFEKKMDLTEHQMEQYIGLAREGSDRLQLAGRTLLATRTNDIPLLCEMAYDISTVRGLKVRDFSLADEALKQAENLAATNTTFAAYVGLRRSVWLFESGKHAEGIAKAKELIAENQNSVEATNLQMLVNLMEKRVKILQSRKGDLDTNAPPEENPATPNGAEPAGQGAGATKQ